jgi:adenylate cyclase class 2
MLEVEMKFPGADFAAVERRLAEWGAAAGEALEEADHYFNAPDREFARTDEALRLRRVGPANFVTYKGPKRGTRGKTRTEIEVPLAEGDQAADDFRRLLIHLGYRSTAVVHKRRRLYRVRRDGYALEVCLDEVEGLGQFAELEIRAPEAQAEAAQEVLRATAAALGLPEKEERRSYLEMLLSARGAEGKAP